MKKMVVLALTVTLYSCYAEKDVQVSILNAQLVKIDTVYRYTGSEQLLVWKCSNNIEYVSYVPLDKNYTVGSKMIVMVPR